jgi:hypothetical protein
MREAFDVMSEHPFLTIFLGFLLLGVLSEIKEIVKKKLNFIQFLNNFTFLLFAITCLIISFMLPNFLLSILCCFMSGTILRVAISNFQKK